MKKYQSNNEEQNKSLVANGIENYPCELHVTADNGKTYIINYDGLQGELTKAEWRGDDTISMFDEESQDKILSALEMTYNLDFFAK